MIFTDGPKFTESSTCQELNTKKLNRTVKVRKVPIKKCGDEVIFVRCSHAHIILLKRGASEDPVDPLLPISKVCLI